MMMVVVMMMMAVMTGTFTIGHCWRHHEK